jgi:hypothetical protein
MQQKLSDLLDFWQRKRGARLMPARTDVDVLELRPWLGYVHMVEVLEGGADFRYRIYGTEIAVAFGSDLTGKRLSAVPAAAREAVRRSYAMACQSCAPLFLSEDPLLTSSLERVESLILPLSGDGVVVDRLLIGIARAGRVREPVPPERRRAPRVATLAGGRLGIGAGWQSCIVLDYSAQGARLELDRAMAVGGRVTLAFADFPPVPGRVAWQDGRCAGIEFAVRLTGGGDA